jgi:hypothetical protein
MSKWVVTQWAPNEYSKGYDYAACNWALSNGLKDVLTSSERSLLVIYYLLGHPHPTAGHHLAQLGPAVSAALWGWWRPGRPGNPGKLATTTTWFTRHFWKPEYLFIYSFQTLNTDVICRFDDWTTWVPPVPSSNTLVPPVILNAKIQLNAARKGSWLRFSRSSTSRSQHIVPHAKAPTIYMPDLEPQRLWLSAQLLQNTVASKQAAFQT